MPIQRIVGLLIPRNPLNINPGERNLHRAEDSGGPTYPPNLAFLGAPGANRQRGSYQPLAQPLTCARAIFVASYDTGAYFLFCVLRETSIYLNGPT